MRSSASLERSGTKSPGIELSPKSIKRQKSKKGIMLELLDDDDSAAKAIR